MRSSFVLLKVGDPKQKRKKGIFTKQGGDKEVLSTFPMLPSFFCSWNHLKNYKEQGL
jgi:hypothetical protein